MVKGLEGNSDIVKGLEGNASLERVKLVESLPL